MIIYSFEWVSQKSPLVRVERKYILAVLGICKFYRICARGWALKPDWNGYKTRERWDRNDRIVSSCALPDVLFACLLSVTLQGCKKISSVMGFFQSVYFIRKFIAKLQAYGNQSRVPLLVAPYRLISHLWLVENFYYLMRVLDHINVDWSAVLS